MALDFPNAPTNGQSFTGPDGTVWTWDGVKWVGGASASGLITAQQIDYDTLRLTAVGTKLKALGPIGAFNAPTASSTNAALDGAQNVYGVPGDHTWNLPVAVPGICLEIMLPNGTSICTIRPAGSDLIATPGSGTNYSNAAPMVIPACLFGLHQILILSATAPGIWNVIAMSPEIAGAMGWVSRPYFCAEIDNGGVNYALPNGVWGQVNFDNVLYDNNGWFSSNPNWYYQPKRKGVYRASWSLTAGDVATGQTIAVGARITVNGQTLVTRFMSWNGTAYLPNQNVLAEEALVRLNGVSDYLQAQVYVNATTPIFIIGQNMFIIEYLGP